VSLRRAFVDEHHRTGCLDEDRVTLPDVERRHAQAGRRRDGAARR
jgi:hypothetical protein